jgi:hypothetical protein
MKVFSVSDTSPENAFSFLAREESGFFNSLHPRRMIYMSGDLSEDLVKKILTENPGLCVVHCEEPSLLSENTIVRKYSLDRTIHKGAKKWNTKYMILKGISSGTDCLKINGELYWETKNDAEDAAKAYTSETGIDTHVIIGRSPDNFLRLQTTINYKSNQKKFNNYDVYWEKF